MTHPIPDERLTAPAVREWASIRRERTAAARKLRSEGKTQQEVADTLGVPWGHVDRLLSGDLT